MRWAGVMSGSSTRGIRRAECRDTVEAVKRRAINQLNSEEGAGNSTRLTVSSPNQPTPKIISYLPIQPRPSHSPFPESLIHPLPLHHNTTTTTITDLTKHTERRLPRLTLLLLRHDNRRIKVKVKIHLRKRIRKRWEWHLTPW